MKNVEKKKIPKNVSVKEVDFSGLSVTTFSPFTTIFADMVKSIKQSQRWLIIVMNSLDVRDYVTKGGKMGGKGGLLLGS
jgi:hypothetical protein